MKKKTVFIAASVVIILAIVCIFAFVRPGQKNNNSSRREGGAQVMDDDLSAVDGSELEISADASSAEVPAEDQNVLKDSTIAGNINNPVTEDVQVVRSVSIPEAVVIGDGDAGAFYSNEDFIDVIPVDISSFSEKDVPEKYDSRDVNGKRYVTDVKDQGYSYLCWSFASMGAIESDLLKHHENMGYQDINLSEKHLAYYNLHKAVGSLGNMIDDDYRELVNADGNANDWIFDYDTGYITCGSVTNCCICLLSSWKGPVVDEGNDSFDAIYGSNYVFTENDEVPSPAYTCDYHVQGVYQIPAVISNQEMIKQMVMEHGAATIGINASSKYFNNNNSNLYSHFGGKTPHTADHEVLIVGWDDNYSASNFRDKPEGDGAWLCRNSWGPNAGKEGFFYASYYDETIGISCAASYDVASAGEKNWYDNNYQAAGFYNTLISTIDDAENYVTALSASTNPYGMMYEAGSAEELKAIGFMGLDMYQQYEVDIYVNPSDNDGDISFENDLPVLTQKISAISGGYHTYELDDPIQLETGDNFFILIKPFTSGRLVYETDVDNTGYANFDEWQNFTGNIHTYYTASGRSYYISDDGKSMVKQNDKDFFVKAYTVNK